MLAQVPNMRTHREGQCHCDWLGLEEEKKRCSSQFRPLIEGQESLYKRPNFFTPQKHGLKKNRRLACFDDSSDFSETTLLLQIRSFLGSRWIGSSRLHELQDTPSALPRRPASAHDRIEADDLKQPLTQEKGLLTGSTHPATHHGARFRVVLGLNPSRPR